MVLTLGATNAYLSGAASMAVDLAGRYGKRVGARSARPFLALTAAIGVLLIGLYGLRVVSPTQLVGLPTTLFLAVYLGCTVSAARVLRGAARRCAVVAVVAVAVVLAFSGWALAVAAGVAGVAALAVPAGRPR